MNRTIIASAASTAFFAAAAVLAGPTPSFAQLSGQLVSTGHVTAASAPSVSEIVVTKVDDAPAAGAANGGVWKTTDGGQTQTREHILLARQVGVPAAASEAGSGNTVQGNRVGTDASATAASGTTVRSGAQLQLQLADTTPPTEADGHIADAKITVRKAGPGNSN